MGERYHAMAAGVAVGTNLTMLVTYNGLATPTRRFSMYEIIVGSVAAAADIATRFTAGRTTTAGTGGTAFAPVALDGTMVPECAANAGIFSTTEPTYTANKELLQFSLNQRATFRWVAAPGSELRGAATQNNGIGIRSRSSTGTPATETCVFFEE